jgi:hypothetical protein
MSVERRLGHFLGSPLMKESREDLTFTVAIAKAGGLLIA